MSRLKTSRLAFANALVKRRGCTSITRPAGRVLHPSLAAVVRLDFFPTILDDWLPALPVFPT
jgi:hypothetical protein